MLDTLYNPSTYMRMRGYPEAIVIECMTCPTRFPACEGIAFEAMSMEGEAVVATFCTSECYLAAFPRNQMWRA